jgi:hypothetical protein
MTRYVYKPKRSTLKLYDFMCNSLRFLHIVSHNFVQTFSIFYHSLYILSAFRPRGVPGPTSKLSPRVPAQMGQRETEHGGGEERERGNPRPPCCPAPRSGALAVGGYKRPRGGRARDSTRRPVLPRGQPSRKRALYLPFIGVRRGPRCTVGSVAMC